MRNWDGYHHILNDDDRSRYNNHNHHTCNSRSVFSSSYSMLTSQPPDPLSLGQQLIDKGISESSLLVNLNEAMIRRDLTLTTTLKYVQCVFHSHLHLSTPTPVLTGNGLAGFFSPITLLVLKSSLSMLGCVCSWIALLVVFCSSSLVEVTVD